MHIVNELTQGFQILYNALYWKIYLDPMWQAFEVIS
jgi:hypothetical protein